MADIVLKDRIGNSVEYPGVERVKLNTVDGETVEFVDSALVPESVQKVVSQDELNFASGAINLTPENGQVFSGVNIPVPTNLTADKIKEGVNIAGIWGTLSAGGGSNVLIKKVTFASNASGTITLATAEELSTVGFDPVNNKCFIAIVPNSYIGTSKTSPGVLVGALVVKHSLFSNTTNYYGILLTGYYSNAKTNPSYKVVTNNPFSGNLVTDTPCYVDGNIVYDATNSNVLLDNDTFFVLAGNLTATV